MEYLMPDEAKSPGGAPSSPWLSRIAQALGVPVSRFYAGDGELQASDQSKLDDTAVLALVRAYLRAAEPATRRHFVEEVTSLVDQLSP